METLKKVQLFIENNQLLTPKGRVIVGVSGGVDSVVMLNILTVSGYECVVAHCNFHLRGKESDRDEQFVADLAQKYGLICKKVDFDTVNYAKRHKISIEMAARDLRYDWFAGLLKEMRAEAIAVAHHSDDSIETMLINSIRGSGLRGLYGIDERNGNIIRPMLSCSREEIENYAHKNNLNYVVDSTNAASDYLRNKFRNEILPALAVINPSVKVTFLENMNRVRGAWKIYDQKIREIKEEISFTKDNQLYIDLEKLKQQVDVTTVLFELLQPYHFKNSIVNDIVDGLKNNSGAKFFSDTHCVLKDRIHLIVRTNKTKSDIEYSIDKETASITEPVSMEFREFLKTDDFQFSRKSDIVHVDADKLKYPLILRPWRKGDTFYPFGMTSKKKVSNFFIDQKINRFQKDDIWLLISDEEIIWIAGLRLDNRFRITEETRNILEIRINQ
ncbi:MAG TPA: tRNA lysidine(34) synthetase TilS [Paludibacteraceae bacterium]|nr:tRNA lysidine(34) synthetase TilS [Paludibacteraceae bacterium]HPT43717.1 tRNA lysidine(34) synthetase TilS [Paludibacteraceae bacterium]